MARPVRGAGEEGTMSADHTNAPGGTKLDLSESPQAASRGSRRTTTSSRLRWLARRVRRRRRRRARARRVGSEAFGARRRRASTRSGLLRGLPLRPTGARVVPRREAERRRELRRPPRLRGPAEQGGPHLGRRGRRGAHLHLQPPSARGGPLREHAEAPRGGEGRPRHHLHAARPGGVITMLACARMGAIHSVVFAGWGPRRCGRGSSTARRRLSSARTSPSAAGRRSR